MPSRSWLSALALCLSVFTCANGQETVDFQRHIRELLSDRCFTCHGPDGEAREAELRLDLKDHAFRESQSGTGLRLVEPGDPKRSELFLRITAEDADARMPPVDSNLKLSPDEVSLIRRWIEQGATWSEHWSFTPARGVGLPEVKQKDWPRNAIDFFVLAQLERAGVAHAGEASREKLIRRVTFDLTGLPPTLKEIDDFLADDAPQAYERVVDRLLLSSRYGERMAADWLDVARYSDTYGYQVDRDRFVWPWRDWVVRAFNSNMPYDRFITEQLAGDLLADASDDQILATTFNRLHPQKVEGGSVPEEFRIEYVSDRTQTFATAFLGLTLECARCHDHKYDPITQKEYYQLSAFFDKIDEAGLYSYFTPAIPTPTLLLVDDATKTKIADIEQRIAAETAKLTELERTRGEAFQTWHAETIRALAGTAVAGQESPTVKGLVKHLSFQDYEGPNGTVDGPVGKAVRLTGDDGIGVDVGNFRRFEPFSVSLWLKTPRELERAVVFHRSRAWTDAGSRGYQLLLEDGCLSASLIHFWPGNAIRIRTREKIPVGDWQHVVMTYDGSSTAAGLRLYVDGQPAATDVARDKLYKNITGGGGDNITIGERFRDRGFTDGEVDEFCVFNRELTPLEATQLHDPKALRRILALQTSQLEPPQRAALYRYYLSTEDAEYAAQLAVLRQVREARSQTVDAAQELMVMREMSSPRQTYLLRRGAYDKRADPVMAETPSVFPPFPADASRDRLGLARWLADPEHPLTARVAVNRIWQMCFGAGLVRTPEDFGRQGQPPTHPALLDWLAHDFVAGDWDVKRLLKLLVMSATYRQASSVSTEQFAADPENRLFGRAPSYRLSAEMLRDNALAASGLLVEKVGGPPARPYEVEASFKPVGRDKGDNLYRRSVYTYWKRTAPAPVMMTLDASKREVCRVRRERTASPLQALVTLNGPQFVEASRCLAERLIKQHGDDDQAILIDMFRTLTSRRPGDAEMRVLQELYKTQTTHFAKDPAQASEFLKTGDTEADQELAAVRLAALGIVANALLNFDECVMKR